MASDQQKPAEEFEDDARVLTLFDYIAEEKSAIIGLDPEYRESLLRMPSLAKMTVVLGLALAADRRSEADTSLSTDEDMTASVAACRIFDLIERHYKTGSFQCTLEEFDFIDIHTTGNAKWRVSPYYCYPHDNATLVLPAVTYVDLLPLKDYAPRGAYLVVPRGSADHVGAILSSALRE